MADINKGWYFLGDIHEKGAAKISSLLLAFVSPSQLTLLMVDGFSSPL